MSSRPSRASLFGVLDTVATLLTVVSAVAAVAVFLYPVGIAEDRLIQQPVADVTDVTSLPRHVTGLSSARVVLMEFSDFSCEFCQRHQRDVFPELMQRFVNTGRARYAVRQLPLRQSGAAQAAMMIAECAAIAGAFWPVREVLFARPGKTSALEMASGAALDSETARLLANCVEDSPVNLTRALGDDVIVARRLKVEATPTFFVGLALNETNVRLLKRINGAQSVRVFASLLEWAAGRSDGAGSGHESSPSRN